MSLSKSSVLLIATGLVLLGGGGATYWQYTRKSELETRVADLTKKAQSAEELKGVLEQSAKDLSEYSEKLKHLERGIPALAYIPTLLTELESTGVSHGIDVLGVRPIAPKEAPKKDEEKKREQKKPYVELDIEVKGRGGYYAVMSFLDALQTFPKIAAVRSVGLSPQNILNQAGPKKLEITVEVRTYLFKEAPKVKTDLSSQLDNREIRGG